jgi:hypothetical protein
MAGAVLNWAGPTGLVDQPVESFLVSYHEPRADRGLLWHHHSDSTHLKLVWFQQPTATAPAASPLVA